MDTDSSSGSRPADRAAARSFSIPLPTPSARKDRTGSQPSAHSTMSARLAGVAAAPTRIGGWGDWIGFGNDQLSVNSTNLPE